MVVKALLFWLLWCLPDVRNDPIEPLASHSFLNETDFGNCSIPATSTTITSTSLDPTTAPPSTTPFLTTFPSTIPPSPTVPEETTAPSTTITAPSSSTVVSSSPSLSTVTSTVLSTFSTEETTARQEESTTSVSTGPGSDSSVAFSTSSTSTKTGIDSTSAVVTSGSLSTSPSTADPTSQTSTSISSPASPTLSTSSTAPTPSSSSSPLSSILGLSSTIPSSTSVSTKASTTPSATTTEGKTSSPVHSSSSTLTTVTEETSTATATTILGRSSSSQGISSTPSSPGSPLDTTMPTMAQETTPTPTKTSSTTEDAVTSQISSSTLPSTTQPRTSAFEDSSSVASPSLSPSTSSSGLQGDTSTGSQTTELLSSSSLSSGTSGITFTTTENESTEGWTTRGSTEGVSTTQATETTGGASSTAWDEETTTFTSSAGPSTLSTIEMDSSTSFSSPVTPGKSSQTTISDPTTRPPPIEVRRTAPGQQQQHPATSSEKPGTTVEGATETSEKKTTVTAPVSMATTLKEILSGRRYITPIRPATTSTTSIPSSPASAETSSSPASSTGITTGISSRNPSTPWELPMTAVQTTKKEILSGRRYVTPEKNGFEKASTTIGSGNVETTVLSTAGTTVFAPGTTEKIGTTIVSDPGTGVSTTLGISSSVSSSTQSVTSTPSQTSVETSPLLTTSTETVFSSSVASSSVSSLSASSPAGATSTLENKETSSVLTSKVAVETTVQPATTRPATSSTGRGTEEMKETTESKTTSVAQSTAQELEMTSILVSSTVPSRTEEPRPTTVIPASPSLTTGSERSVTSTAAPTATTSRPTTLRPYGQGCEERCPEGALPGTGRCYQLAPENYYLKFHLSFSYCGRDRVGHLIEKEELMQDLLLIRKWMGSMDFAANTSIYVGPFVTVGSQIRGEYTTLSRVSGGLVPTEIIKMEEIRNAVGICAVPEFCGTFNCSFEPLYQSLRGLLAEPMPSPVSPGTAVRVQCLSPSNTVLALKCDSYGKFNPRPGTASVTCRVSRAFSREQEVPDNKPIRESCDCYQDGTDSCQAVEGGFKCECKKNWRKNSCWKSPDMCWVPTGHVNKCNGHGRCHSYPDLFVCKCDSGFGGATCALNLTNVTWFGSPDSVPFLTARKIVVVTVSSMDWAEMILKALLKSSALVSSDGPRDPLSYTSSMRKFCVGAAGLASVLFSHPNYFFPMFSFGCRMMFFIINSLMLYAFWLLIMESFITCCVYYGIGRNRWDLGVEKAKKDNWYEVDKPKDRWYLSKWFLVYSGVIYSLLIEIFLFNVYYDVIPSPFTCLGEITSLRNPGTIVNLEIMAVMAYISTGFGLLSQVFKRLWPERLAEQRSYFEWHKGRDAVETLNKVERCQGLQIIQAPVIFMTYLFNVWCQDRVATGLPQTLEMYFSVFLVSVSVFIAAYGTIAYWPWLYGHVMKQILPLLPWLPVWTHYSPSEHGYLTHEEIINRNKGKDVILSENRGWPKHPSEKFYVSLERREQCRRRLSRQYLEMRLMGVVKHDALKLIGDRFLLAVPEGDPESEQWEKLLETWTRRVRRVDRTEFKIPRNRPENREDYWTRILAAPLFTRADVLMENSDWLRFLYAYQLLGHIPLQDVDKKEGEYPQIRHYLQHGPYQAAWDRICTKGTWPKVASLLSPELYPDQDKTQRVRGEAHTALINLPGVKRYLTGDFLDKIFFVLQQARLRKTAMENEIVEEPNLHGLEKIRLKVQERRIVPQAIDHLGRAQWLAGRDLITLNQPNVAALLGDNDKPVDPVRIPPLIIEREGIPSCLYRW